MLLPPSIPPAIALHKSWQTDQTARAAIQVANDIRWINRAFASQGLAVPNDRITIAREVLVQTAKGVTPPPPYWLRLDAFGTLFVEVRLGGAHQLEALDALLDGLPWLGGRGLFAGERWRAHRAVLASAFHARCNDKSWSEVWREVARPALLFAIHQAEDSAYMFDVPTLLRCEMRKTVERELLDGETLDQYGARQRKRVTMPEGGEGLDILADTTWAGFQSVENFDGWQDFLTASSSLRPEHAETVLARMWGFEFEEIARAKGVVPATVRSWHSRGMQRLQAMLMAP